MSYSAFGETATWLGILANTSEVYVFRFRAKSFTPRSPADLLTIVRAVGESSSFQTKLDVRGIAIWHDAGMAEDEFVVDVVTTSPQGGLAIIVPSPQGFLDSVIADPDVRTTFPQSLFSSPELLQLVGPADAVDHWRSQPVLWDQSLVGRKGHGGPTDTFANPAEYSIVLGKADDGKRAKPWILQKPGLGPGTAQDKIGSNALLLIVGIGVAGAAWFALAKRKKR